ncbi:MAG TPA: putative toxin-antitoxin system toxin component, PIN family [Pirellulales bacterium]|nr:putative toxin-antitoxin system toxin component, PIN family [Pirellulales bacterium]
MNKACDPATFATAVRHSPLSRESEPYSDSTTAFDEFRGIIYDTIVHPPQIVIDTNVLASALMSRRGASFRLLSLIDSGRFQINVSVPLVLEYEDACKRLSEKTNLADDDIDAILDYVCQVANRRWIHFLWRPLLNDPKDEMVLELAVAASCEYLVTFNGKDFRGAEQFGIRFVTPAEFLEEIGEPP